jgi:phage baseplate assembly protein W
MAASHFTFLKNWEQVINLTDLFNDTDANEVQVITLPTLTYRIVDGHIRGMTDGQDAMRQAIHKILQTERFVWPIYSDQYGNDLIELLGKEMPYVKNEVQRMVTEALTGDDRVTDVAINAISELSSDTLLVNATVTTIFGDFMIETEATVA